MFDAIVVGSGMSGGCSYGSDSVGSVAWRERVQLPAVALVA